MKACAAALLLAGCAPAAGLVSADEFRAKHLNLLGAPDLTRNRVVERLGPPTHEFENGRVACWRLLLMWNDRIIPVPDGPTDELTTSIVRRQGEYGVVLVCAPDGRVESWRVVRVRP